jgi:hypothetical protein
MKLTSLLLIAIIVSPLLAVSQSKTTEALEKQHSDALALFFYNNTLRMLNQGEDKAFDELIKDIEKMKFLMIKKQSDNFGAVGYKKLVGEYKSEAYEEIMTSRFDGKNFDILLKEKDGKTKGMLVLVNDEESLFVLDIIGSIALNNVTKLYETIDKSSDIGQKIKAFTNKDGDRDRDNDDDNEEKEKPAKKN